MKTVNNIFLLIFSLLWHAHTTFAQEDKPSLMVNMKYFVTDNHYQELVVQTFLKVDRKLSPVKDVVLQLYLDSVAPELLIGKVRTNQKGVARAVIPYSLKEAWLSAGTHRFIAVTEATQRSEEFQAELEITKAKISIDTLLQDDERMVCVKVTSLENGNWVPAKDVEVKLGVRRLGSVLNINETESFSTDSVGNVSGVFSLDSIPAINQGNNITLVAQVIDNEMFGNLSVEKAVPWGVYSKPANNFDRRSLWGTADKVPIWLLLVAAGIFAGVWGVIGYLLILLVKIIKDGRQTAEAYEQPVTADNKPLTADR